MTSHQTEGVLLGEKPLNKMASVLEDSSSNGTLEINGHSLPDNTQLQSPSDSIPNQKDETTSGPAAIDDQVAKNDESFAANQNLKEEATKVEEQKPMSPEGDSSAEEPKEEVLVDAPKEPSVPASEEKPTQELKEESKVKGEPEPEKKASAPQHDESAAPETAVPEVPVAETAATDTAIATNSATETPAGSEPLKTEQEDVEMKEAPAATELPPPADAAHSTQDTAISDVPPVTPVEETNVPTAESSSMNIDGKQASPAAPATADTSMSDAPPPSSTKVSRERDIDSEDEPVAKRTKVSPAADQVEVKPAAPVATKMEVDGDQQKSASPYLPSGEPKKLSDDSLNGNPITDWQSKKLREILAGVKKTKAGANFRLSVAQLWPGLWNDYIAKVPNPVDINMMEKRLRGDMPKYGTMGDFKRDLDQLVKNSILFNGEVHEVTHAARSAKETILERMKNQPAAEPPKPERKELAKQHPTRHHPTEPNRPPSNSTAQSSTPQQQRPKPASPPPKQQTVESPAFAIPPSNHGMPLIRRDSTKPDARNKRPVKPAVPKDLVYDHKRKKKLSPELRFCEEVINELRKAKYFEINQYFLTPVDPVALNIPHYHKVIKKPMDLGTMFSKLNAGEYLNWKEFDRDFNLIISNCKTFNGEEHIVTHAANRLAGLYRKEMSKKDEWMAKHAPPPPPTTGYQGTAQNRHASPSARSHHNKAEDSDDEMADSEHEPEMDEERKSITNRLAGFQKRLQEEQTKLNDLIMTGPADMADVEISQQMVAMLQKQLIEQRAKLAALGQPKASDSNRKPKPKAAKPKKASLGGGGVGGGHSGGNSGAFGNKKSGGGAGGGGAGANSKKAGGKKAAPKRKITNEEKETIAANIGELEGQQLERAIDIIKKDTGAGENPSGELELDIDSLSDDALSKLWDLIIKAFPHLNVPPKTERNQTYGGQGVSQQGNQNQSAARSKHAAPKPKKNKPMSKSEQERRIQQLNELRAQAGRQGSGSQEPMESIEGTGHASPIGASGQQQPQDSEDEESSEEE